MTTLKAITICQPHAWAVVAGTKRFENRKWYCSHRGLLVIHAGTSKDWLKDDNGKPVRIYPDCPADHDLVFGAFVGVVDMLACVGPDDTDGDAYATGPWCHAYANPRAFAEPIPCRGQLNIWDVPESHAAQVNAAIEQLKVGGYVPPPGPLPRIDRQSRLAFDCEVS